MPKRRKRKRGGRHQREAVKLLADPDAIAIKRAALARIHFWISHVERRADSLCKRALGEIADAAAVLADPAVALKWLVGARELLCEEARRLASIESSLFLKWMLRRLPYAVFAGDHPGTFLHDSLVAAALVGTASGTRSPFVDEGRVRFRLDDEAVNTVMQLACFARCIGQIDRWVRWTSKSATLRVSVDAPFTSAELVVSEETRAAVYTYDDRLEDGGSFFVELGIGSSNPLELPEKKRRDAPMIFALVGTPPMEIPMPHGAYEGAVQESNAIWIPLEVGRVFNLLTRLADLETKLARRTYATMVLLLGVTMQLYENPHLLPNTVHVGYYMTDEQTFLARFTPRMAFIEQRLPGSAFEGGTFRSARDLLDELRTIEANVGGESAHGRVIDEEGAFMLVDLLSATDVMIDGLRFPRLLTGDAANARADVFESVVRDAVAQTAWRPEADIAALDGRTIYLNGEPLTDLDALGSRGRQLLLVSCKSVPYSRDYHRGSYSVVRNVRTMLEEAVTRWDAIAEQLRQKPVGSNYDFSRFDTFIPVVCVPFPPYVEGEYLDEVEPGLRRVVSLRELERWMTAE